MENKYYWFREVGDNTESPPKKHKIINVLIIKYYFYSSI